MDTGIENIVANLNRSGRYSRLLNCIADPMLQSFLFELLFANSLEDSEVLLRYEVNVHPGTNATVDLFTKMMIGLLSASNSLARK
ncbi:MAG: hypothetical protein ABSE08_11400 [Syntrophobacteraceae bacterium]